MKSRILFLFLLGIYSYTAWACPGCAGGDVGKNKTPYTLIVLAVFIALTYIPFYLLFRAAKKYDPKNGTDEYN